MIYVANSPFIMMQYLELSPVHYGLYQATPLVISIISIFIYKLLVEKTGVKALLKFSLTGMFVMGPLYLIIAYEVISPTPIFIISIISIQSLLVGFIFPSLISYAMDLFPHNKGMTASLIGFMRSAIAGIILFLVAVFLSTKISTTFTIIAITVFILNIVTLIGWKIIFSHEEKQLQNIDNKNTI
jgi:MFS family permease